MKFNIKLIQHLLLTVVLPIVIISLSGVGRPIELAIYDFNFFLRPTESTDERLVIVGWSESSIQMLEESVISDDSLVVLLSKILQQRPRVIGLDLFRDIPVLSPRLTDRENQAAYDALQKLFRSTSNLIGVEKVIEPIVNPPRTLAQKEQTTASDIPTDLDGTIRRAYLFPETDEARNPVGLPYLGVALGYQYLAPEGWQADSTEKNALLLSQNPTSSVVLRPLKNFLGADHYDYYSLNFLVNWRKGNPSFRTVSVTEVISERVAGDLFQDRLVLIGNISDSTSDRHILPLNRWNSSALPFTHGVEIPAQVASSIVSSALDGRALLNTVSTPVKLMVLAISTSLIALIINKYQNLSPRELYLTSLAYAVAITIILASANLVMFSQGWWMPIATPVIATWIGYFSLNYYFYRDRQRKNLAKFELFIRQLLQHGLGNPLSSIVSSTNRIKSSVRQIQNNSPEEGERELLLALERNLSVIQKKNS